MAPCSRSNRSSHFVRCHKSQPWREEGRKAGRILNPSPIKGRPTTLFLRTPSLLQPSVSLSLSSLHLTRPLSLSPRPQSSLPCSTLLTPPTASRIRPLSPLFIELGPAAPPFPKHTNSFQRPTRSAPFNAPLPSHAIALRRRAPLLSEDTTQTPPPPLTRLPRRFTTLTRSGTHAPMHPHACPPHSCASLQVDT